MTPRLPTSLVGDERAKLFEAERARGSQLLRLGKMRRMWRLPGRASALLLWDVEGPEELHELLTSLPMWQYCDIDVTALMQHPLEAAAQGAA